MSSVTAGVPWQYEDLNFHGLSLSGIRTSIAMPEHHIAFDVAQGYPFLLSTKKFFISHGHLDHAAGIPYLISQKVLFHHAPAEFYMPPSLVEPLLKIMQLWQEIEDHQYPCHFHGVNDDPIEVNPTHFVKAFPTFHRIESFGYTLFKKHKHLNPRLAGADKKTIVAAKARGESIEESFAVPLVSFSGDTQIEFLFARDWIRKSKILFLEATYIDERKSVQNARDWGHTHLDEIIPHLDEIESEKIVFIHISSRYPLEVARKIVFERVPKKFHERIEVFPGR